MPNRYLTIFHSDPSACAGVSRSTAPAGDTALKNPCGCSSASPDAVNPISASRAAISPEWADLPA